MEIVNIHFSSEEKEKLISFLADNEKKLIAKKTVLEKEVYLLAECISTNLPNAPNGFLTKLADRVAERKDVCTTIYRSIDVLNGLIKGVQDTLNVSIDNGLRLVLSELYNKEHKNKSLSGQYNYYPRLKRAKEVYIYEFANKIQTIMESENVRIA